MFLLVLKSSIKPISDSVISVFNSNQDRIRFLYPRFYSSRFFLLSTILFFIVFFATQKNIDAFNLLTNSGLETGDQTGWTDTVSFSSLGIVNSPVYAGGYAAKMYPGSTAGKSRAQIVTVVSGKTYYFCGFFKLENSESVSEFGLFLSTINSAGSVTTSGGSTMTATAPDWIFLSRSTVAGSEIGSMRVHVKIRDAVSNITTGYFDNIYFSEDFAPDAVSDLTALQGDTDGSIKLKWTSPGADGTDGAFANGRFIIKFSSNGQITESNFNNPPLQTSTVTISTSVYIPGEEMGYVTTLQKHVTWYFAIAAYDGLYSTSSWSINGVNILSSGTARDLTAPSPVSDLTALTGNFQGEIILRWSAPGNDGTEFNITSGSFTIRGSTNQISNFATASPVNYEKTISTSGLSPFSSQGILVTGLNPGTTYYFAVVTKDESGNQSDWSYNVNPTYANMSSSNSASDLSPVAITAIYASTATNQITLTWTVPGSPQGTMDYDQFRLYRATQTFTIADYGTGFSSACVVVATVSYPLGQVTTSYTDTGLTNHVTYFYHISLLDTGDQGNGLYSVALESFSAVEIASYPVTSPPLPPSVFTGIARSSVSIQWSWNLSASATFYRLLDMNQQVISTIETLDNSVNSVLENFLSTNTLYGRYVVAGSTNGVSGLSNAATFYTLAMPPDIFSMVSLTSNTINLNWLVNNATSYDTQFSTSSNFSVYNSSNVKTAPMTVTGLSPGVTYYLRIGAKNGDHVLNTLAYSNVLSTRTLPSSVTSLSTAAVVTNSIQWQWSSAIGADGYRLYRATDNSVVTQVSSGVLSYTETGLGYNLQAGRYVKSFISTPSFQETILAPSATVYTLASAPSGVVLSYILISSITVSWSDNGNISGTNYQVEKTTTTDISGNTEPYLSGYMQFKTTNTTSVPVTGLQAGTTYFFRVRAVNGDGLTTLYDSVDGTGAFTYGDSLGPRSITNLSATTWNTNVGSVKLSWTAPGDDPTVGTVAKYQIRYATFNFSESQFNDANVSQVSQTLIPKTPSSDESLVITGLPSGQILYFHIRSTDALGNQSSIDSTSPSVSIAVSSHILISQFAAGIGSSSEEFVELYNPTDSDIDLKALGVIVYRRDNAGSNSTIKDISGQSYAVIPSKGFYLLATSNNETGGIAADAVIPTARITSAGTVFIAAYGYTDPNLAIDRVSHGTLSDSSITDSAISTLGTNAYVKRVPGDSTGNYQDTNNSSNDFVYYASSSSLVVRNSSSTPQPDIVVPSAISDLTGLALSEGNVQLIWTSPGDNGTRFNFTGSYVIKYSSVAIIKTADFDSPSASLLARTTLLSTSSVVPGISVGKVVTGLNPGMWWFAIKSTDSAGHSAVWNSSGDVLTVNSSAFAVVPDEVPAGIQGTPTFSLIMPTALTFQWNVSTAPDISTYMIYYATWSQVDYTGLENYNGTGATQGNSPVSAGNVTSFFLEGLTQYVTYYIAIKSKDGSNNLSGYSQEFSTYPHTTIPSAPTGLAGTAVDQNSVNWVWSGVSNASYYNVYRASSPFDLLSGAIAHPTVSFSQSGLGSNSLAMVQVIAVNSAGQSVKSATGTAYTMAATPAALTVSTKTSGSITLVWNANENSSLTAYQISMANDSSFTQNLSTPVPFSSDYVAVSTTISGLNSETTYYFRAQAKGGGGDITTFSNTVSTCTTSSRSTHLVISQFSYNSPTTSDDDWVEIHNPTSQDIDLTGMSIQIRDGASSFKRTNISGIINNMIKAGGYFLFVKDGSNTQQNLKDLADQLVASSSLELLQSGTTGRTIYLVSSTTTLTTATDIGSTVIDRVAYGTGGTAVNSEGTALSYQTAAAFERKPGTPNANWQDSHDNSIDFKTVTAMDAGRSNVPGYPRNSQSASEPRNIISPDAISDLTALTDNTVEAKVRLSWTAPGSDGTTGTVRGYVINYTTISVIRNNPTVSFSTVTALQVTYSPSSLVSAGHTQVAELTGLPAGVVIYFRVRGYDESVLYGVWNSSMDVASVNIFASTATLDLPPNAPTNFVASASNTAINLSWTLSDSVDADSCEINYSSNSDYVSASTVTITKSVSVYSVTGLMNQVFYYIRIRTIDEIPSLKSNFATASATPILRPPMNLSAAHRDTSVNLNWTLSVDDQTSNFRVYNLRRGLTHGGPYSVLLGALSAATTTCHDTNGIIPGVTYYYTIYSSGSATIPVVSGNGIEGSASNEAIALPDIMPPEITCSQTALLSYAGVPLTVQTTITDYRDAAKTSSGSIQDVRLYYKIVKSTALTTYQSMTPAPGGNYSYNGAAQISAAVILEAATIVSSITYFVTAYDGTNTSTSGIVSVAITKPETKIIGTDGGTLSVSFSDGGQLVMEIPPGSLSVPTPISVTVLDDNNPAPTAKNESNIDLALIPSGKPLSAYEFGPDGLSFTIRPTIKLYYPATAIDKDKLRVFLREGSKWTNQGGKANEQNQVVFKPYHFSKYAVFPSKPSTQKTTEKKFITPNGDGKNDSAEWSEAIREVAVYDITGRELWNGIADQSAKESIQWNGKDKDGIIVEGGAYIYKAVAINNEITYGVIVVIK